MFLLGRALVGTIALAVPAYVEYCAGTMSRQYTIRSVPVEVDQALRRRAQREAKSLNAVAVEALARGLELAATTTVFTDLDSLIGSWQEDPAFDRAMVDFERIDEESWK